MAALKYFNFVKKQNGAKCSLNHIKKEFCYNQNIEETLDACKVLFWIKKLSQTDWTVRAKLDLELCYLYSENKIDGKSFTHCDGDCLKLHLCKSFILGAQFCKTPCKNLLSHDIKDSHNQQILQQYEDVNIQLIRSSFPRLCHNFITEGKCSMFACGSLHLCPDFLNGNCKDACKLVSKCALSKQELHTINSAHNRNVYKSFHLVSNNKSFLFANTLNEGHTVASTNCGDESTFQTRHVLLCTFYLAGNCRRNNKCHYLHLCKEYLVDDTKCPVDNCKLGLSHNLFDGNNGKILSPLGITNDQQVLAILRRSYPRICYDYINGNCLNDNCILLHICDQFVLSNQHVCQLSHELTDKHNADILRRFNLYDMLKSIKFVKTNILVSSFKYTDNHSAADKRRQNIVEFILNNNPQEGSCAIDNTELLSFFDNDTAKALDWFQSQSSWFRIATNPTNKITIHICSVDIEPCQFYWRKNSCLRKHCAKFHFCKSFMLRDMHGVKCKFNHNFANSSIQALIKSKRLETFSEQQILTLLRNRFPFVCTNYQSGSCVETEAFCSKLHICRDYILNKCNKSDGLCNLNHETALEDNQAVRLSKEFNVRKDILKSCLILESQCSTDLLYNK